MTTRTLDVSLRDEKPKDLPHRERIMQQDPREDKLPKWAQQQLTYLRSEIRRVRAEVAQLSHAVGPTDTFLWGGPREDHLPLPKNARIEFAMDGVDYRNLSVGRNYQEPQWLEIMGNDTLEIQSQSSNVIRIRCQPR